MVSVSVDLVYVTLTLRKDESHFVRLIARNGHVKLTHLSSHEANASASMARLLKNRFSPRDKKVVLKLMFEICGSKF